MKVVIKIFNNTIFFSFVVLFEILYFNSVESLNRRYLRKETHTMNTITVGWKKEKPNQTEFVNKKKVSQNRQNRKVKLFYCK